MVSDPEQPQQLANKSSCELLGIVGHNLSRLPSLEDNLLPERLKKAELALGVDCVQDQQVREMIVETTSTIARILVGTRPI